MPEPLDLRELERQLSGLQSDLSGRGLSGLMVDAGEIVRGRWRDNISDAGLVDTGEYLESLSITVLDETADLIRVEIATDARTEDGAPYPFFLEYGTSDIFPHPVAIRAFDESRRRVVKEVGEAIDRKVRSRARK